MSHATAFLRALGGEPLSQGGREVLGVSNRYRSVKTRRGFRYEIDVPLDSLGQRVVAQDILATRAAIQTANDSSSSELAIWLSPRAEPVVIDCELIDVWRRAVDEIWCEVSDYEEQSGRDIIKLSVGGSPHIDAIHVGNDAELRQEWLEAQLTSLPSRVGVIDISLDSRGGSVGIVLSSALMESISQKASSIRLIAQTKLE